MGLWVDQNHTENQNHTEREIGSWVRGSRSKALGRRSVHGFIDQFVDRRSRRRDRWSWRSRRCDRFVDRRSRSRRLSLSLSVHVSLKMVWSENFHFKPFPGQSLQNTRSTENNFRKIYFPCATKHPHLRESISKNDLKPKQTQPKLYNWTIFPYHWMVIGKLLLPLIFLLNSKIVPIPKNIKHKWQECPK